MPIHCIDTEYQLLTHLSPGFQFFIKLSLCCFTCIKNMIQVHSCVCTTEASFNLFSLDFETNTYFSATDDNLQHIRDVLANTFLKSK